MLSCPSLNEAGDKTLRDSLYDVEVVESNPANQKVKIHYRGYSSRYDEWRSASEMVHKPVPVVDL